MAVECTLRAAMEQANYTPGADAINFAIPGSGVKSIAPESALPTITEAVTINGYSQPGAQPNTKAVGSDAVLKIELNGADVPDGDGLVIEASNSTVRGLVINRWANGIFIDGSDATGNKVTGNYLGTDASGTQDLGNNIGVLDYDPNNTVGGTTPAARNVISGNSYGVAIIGANGTKVAGNYIGTDASGTKDLGNGGNGVQIEFGSHTIGGATAGERNVISGNEGNGVLITGNDSEGNKVMGNYVGTDKNGAAPLANSANGVYISAQNNTVGGTTAGGSNVISANAGSGVSIYGNSAKGNRILQNSIFSNGGLGIDLYDDGPTANDPGDADTGPNDLQNKPLLFGQEERRGHHDRQGHAEQHPRQNLSVAVLLQPFGHRRGQDPPRLQDRLHRRNGQHLLHLLDDEDDQAGAEHYGHGNGSGRKHL